MKEKISELLFDLKVLFYPKKFEPKVFCIGYNKTGTTTIGKCFEIMGYKNSSFNKKVWRKYYKNKQFSKIIDYTAKFESFDDLPWLKEDMIPLLDRNFPGSKFVYLERDEASWKKSFREWTYLKTGTYPDENKGFQDFLSHRKFVLNYFKNRNQDFTILDVKDPEGFKKLGKFLNKKVPQKNFPRFNSTDEFKSLKQ